MKSKPQPACQPQSILWWMTNALDSDAMALWCEARIDCDCVDTAHSLEQGIARCKALRPTLLGVDPSLDEKAVARAVGALYAGWTDHVLVLDRTPREGCLLEVLDEPDISYLSRAAGPAALAAAIASVLERGTRVIDPTLSSRLRSTDGGYTLKAANGSGSVATLTLRELQVMRMLAGGKSVSQCAAALGIAQSTIGNHKSRLMKKLGVHKATELTCRAIRDGLIAL
jgi:two-component system, NarL family, response regulator NreC